MAPAMLTSATLAAHDAADAVTNAPIIDPEAQLREAEASLARREHVHALLREYEQLQALSPAEASGWQQRRERAAACSVQTMWRRRTSRRAFIEVIHYSQLQKRAKAATTIQRAQRTRQRLVSEAAPSITRQEVVALQRETIDRTLSMALEMRAARDVRDEWRAAGHSAADEEPPPLPEWATAPSWLRELEEQRAGGSALTQELRASAQRGLAADDQQREMLAAVRDWPHLRASLQGAAVRRQVARTQAAALHAQLRHPPQLPPSSHIRASKGGVETTLPPVMPSKPSVLAAHRRELLAAKLEEEGAPIEPRKAHSVTSRPPLSPATASQLGDRISNLLPGLPSGTVLSPAELLWLSSLHQ